MKCSDIKKYNAFVYYKYEKPDYDTQEKEREKGRMCKIVLFDRYVKDAKCSKGRFE